MWNTLSRRVHPILIGAAVISLLALCACSSDGGGSSDDDGASTTFSAPDCSGSTTLVDGTFTSEVPDWIKNNFKCIDASVSGDNIIIKTKSLPPYLSAYYADGATLKDDDAPTMPTTGSYTHKTNPNEISAQEATFTIPKTPITTFANLDPGFTEASADSAGVAVDGLAIFNAFAAPGDELADEAWTMDNNNGHPTNGGIYHYHVEPWQLTDVDGNRVDHSSPYNPARLVGISLDGLPIYGAHDQAGRGVCASTTCLPALDDGDTDIDGDVAANFHCHTTDEFDSSTGYSDGVCHYHVLTNYDETTTEDLGPTPIIPMGTTTNLRYMVKYWAHPDRKGSADYGSATAAIQRRFRMTTLLANALMCGPNGLPIARK